MTNFPGVQRVLFELGCFQESNNVSFLVNEWRISLGAKEIQHHFLGQRGCYSNKLLTRITGILSCFVLSSLWCKPVDYFPCHFKGKWATDRKVLRKWSYAGYFWSLFIDRKTSFRTPLSVTFSPSGVLFSVSQLWGLHVFSLMVPLMASDGLSGV